MLFRSPGPIQLQPQGKSALESWFFRSGFHHRICQGLLGVSTSCYRPILPPCAFLAYHLSIPAPEQAASVDIEAQGNAKGEKNKKLKKIKEKKKKRTGGLSLARTCLGLGYHNTGARHQETRTPRSYADGSCNPHRVPSSQSHCFPPTALCPFRAYDRTSVANTVLTLPRPLFAIATRDHRLN